MMFILKLRDSSADRADLYFSSTIMRPSDDFNDIDQLEYLYPHDTDCICVMVPVTKDRKPFLAILFQEPILIPIGCCLLTMMLLRIVQRQEPWPDAILCTIGMFFAQQFRRENRTVTESLWSGWMLAFVFYSTTLMSSTLYQIIVMTSYEPEIDTFAQLKASNIPIIASAVMAIYQFPELVDFFPTI